MRPPLQILVIDKGVIAEQGTHSELLAKPEGRYTQMWALQQMAATEGTENIVAE
jgi:ABC-type multidrug transport system fused ATPase/permease subunit